MFLPPVLSMNKWHFSVLECLIFKKLQSELLA